MLYPIELRPHRYFNFPAVEEDFHILIMDVNSVVRLNGLPKPFHTISMVDAQHPFACQVYSFHGSQGRLRTLKLLLQRQATLPVCLPGNMLLLFTRTPSE